METYFAKVDKSNTVLQVIVSGADYINSGRLGNPEDWVECFMDEEGVTNPKNIYPGIGYNYNPATEVFYPNQPYYSWTLDANYVWQPPIPKPEQTDNEAWAWDEDSQSWYDERRPEDR